MGQMHPGWILLFVCLCWFLICMSHGEHHRGAFLLFLCFAELVTVTGRTQTQDLFVQRKNRGVIHKHQAKCATVTKCYIQGCRDQGSRESTGESRGTPLLRICLFWCLISLSLLTRTTISVRNKGRSRVSVHKETTC